MTINEIRLKPLFAAVLLASASPVTHATDWTTAILGGTMTFDDWGYTGPQGQTAEEFSYNGFDGAAQIQRVVTTGPDYLTPDAPQTILEDGTTTKIYHDANMDSQTNFYKWGYTTKAGSTFDNMQIDADGDYLVKRNDMAFSFYDGFDYRYEGTAPDQTALPLGVEDGWQVNNIGFQPYALSDAEGWCGSVTASHPGALEAMAGQVTFDFGFEAYLAPNGPSTGANYVPGKGAMQIVQDFVMRSYGSLTITTKVADGGTLDTTFNATAVVNNTNPMTVDGGTDPLNPLGTNVDANNYNEVSFMGGGIVPDGVWVKLIDPNGPISDANISEVLDADDGAANTVWHNNSFSGYPFMLRADGIRIMTWADYNLYGTEGAYLVNEAGEIYNYDETGAMVVVQNLSAVPVPAAVWLFGSGLLGLIGVARKRRV